MSEVPPYTDKEDRATLRSNEAEYRGTSLIRNSVHLGTYRSICLGAFGVSRGVSVFL